MVDEFDFIGPKKAIGVGVVLFVPLKGVDSPGGEVGRVGISPKGFG
jgi:hypothetical protein